MTTDTPAKAPATKAFVNVTARRIRGPQGDWQPGEQQEHDPKAVANLVLFKEVVEVKAAPKAAPAQDTKTETPAGTDKPEAATDGAGKKTRGGTA